jgi:hypothetical protein
LFFGEQTVPAVIDAVERFEAATINPADCRAWAENFSLEAFRSAFGGIVQIDAQVQRKSENRLEISGLPAEQ